MLPDTPKTKVFADLLKKLKIKERVLLIVEKPNRNMLLATRNIKRLTVKKVDEATALDVLSNTYIIITKGAAEALNKRVKK